MNKTAAELIAEKIGYAPIADGDAVLSAARTARNRKIIGGGVAGAGALAAALMAAHVVRKKKQKNTA